MLNILITLIIINGITGKIQGIVMDEATNKPIPYADVIILDTEIGTATDENGRFYILNVPSGTYTVEFSCIGYQIKHIKDVVVEIDRTVRLNVKLVESAIELSPITVTSEMPAVKKDYVGTTYIVRKTELAALPIDYTINLVTFQPAVARQDTSIHVRGGRATEVQYMIDNVSIIDPQTGDPAINISKGIVDEIIFLPGGFDAEYGKAMSGVINIVTEHPLDKLSAKIYGKTETIMPFYYDFGYQNYLSSIHLPVSKRFKGFVSFDLMHTDDWNPRLFILPHKQRDDYSLYSKWLYAPSGKLKLIVSGAQSRIQFDRYFSSDKFYKFHLDHYRSDMSRGNLQTVNVNYLPDSKKFFTLTLSRLFTRRIYGVREQKDYGFFENFTFKAYQNLEWPRASNMNPFGTSYIAVICDGDYPEYQDKSSQLLTASAKTILQLHKYHEIRGGFEYTLQNFDNFTYFVSDSLHQIIDDYEYQPKEFSIYVQDNVDYEGLYAKVGCRYDYFSSDIEGIKPKTSISPRFGFSFMVTEKFLFRANVGRYTQPPLYDYMYGYYNLLPLPSYLYKYYPIVGNPGLEPEKTISYEIGLQGEITRNLNATVNTFYKDVSDLIGNRFITAWPRGYFQYVNVEYANIKGIEWILEFANSIFTGKISYTLSWARGTSSYAGEYADTSITRPATDYYLDFDQRHRFFIQGIVNLPFKSQLYLFGYLGQGFPYTPPGPEGKYEEINILRLPFQKQIDCVISKSFKLGSVKFKANIEVINLLDERYEIASHYPMIPLEQIKMWEFTDFIALDNSYYHPAADFNHDGLITPYEEYTAFRELIKATDDWVNAYSAPRRARIGVAIQFQ
jgi:hypothetical protein